MERITNGVDLNDVENPYPKDQIEKARAELKSIFDTESGDPILAELKRKLKAAEKSAGINSKPLVVDFNNTINSYGHIISVGECNAPNHHDVVGNKLHNPSGLHSSDHPGVDQPNCGQNHHENGNQNHHGNSDTLKMKVYPKHWFCERFKSAKPYDRLKYVNSNRKRYSLDNREKFSQNINGKLTTDTCKNEENCKMAGHSQTKLPKPMKVNFLHCDLCDFSVLDNSEMMSHLKCNQHFSASLVEGTLQKEKFCPLCVVKESYLVNKESKYKKIVPICLKCDNIFPTIYMCAMHFQIHHDRDIYDKYTVALVTEEKAIVVSIHNFTCNTCKTGHLTETALLNHWIKNNHLPLRSPENGTIVYFFCEYCAETRPFYHFSDAYKHILKSHHREHIGGDLYLRVRYIKRSPVGKLLLLQHSRMSIQKQYEYDIKTVNMMIQPLNRCDTEKQNKRTKDYLDELKKQYVAICQ